MGRYRRRLDVVADAHGAFGAIEDDFHSFDVRIGVRGGRVETVQGTPRRYPWTTCPGAVEPLRALEGILLDPGLMRRKAVVDTGLQCTHMYELALVVIAQAARFAAGGAPVRRYDVAIEDRRDRTLFPYLDDADRLVQPPGSPDGWATARLHRDGNLVLDWRVEGSRIVSPPDIGGIDFRKTGAWANANGDDDLVEAVKILRQGIAISEGRAVPFSAASSAADFTERGAVCHSFQFIRRGVAMGTPDSARDFSDNPDALLADFEVRHVGVG